MQHNYSPRMQHYSNFAQQDPELSQSRSRSRTRLNSEFIPIYFNSSHESANAKERSHRARSLDAIKGYEETNPRSQGGITIPVRLGYRKSDETFPTNRYHDPQESTGYLSGVSGYGSRTMDNNMKDRYYRSASPNKINEELVGGNYDSSKFGSHGPRVAREYGSPTVQRSKNMKNASRYRHESDVGRRDFEEDNHRRYLEEAAMRTNMSTGGERMDYRPENFNKQLPIINQSPYNPALHSNRMHHDQAYLHDYEREKSIVPIAHSSTHHNKSRSFNYENSGKRVGTFSEIRSGQNDAIQKQPMGISTIPPQQKHDLPLHNNQLNRQYHRVRCCCFSFTWPLWSYEPTTPPQPIYRNI